MEAMILALSLPFTLAWISIIVSGLALEAVALLRKGRGETLSEHVWALLRKSVVIWFLGLGLFAWLAVHFFGFGIVDGWIRRL